MAGAWAMEPHEVLAYSRPVLPSPPGDKDCTRWALLSDTHVAADPENRYRGFFPYLNLQEVATQIADKLPDRIVISGDLARLKGETDAYENFKTLLAPVARQRPIHLGLGNHDDREDFFRAFKSPTAADMAIENKHIVEAEAGPVRLIVLDTLLHVNGTAGELGLSQRSWLETFLRRCDNKPTILFLHHTLSSDLLDTRPLLEIIRPVAKVKAVVYGHSHRYEFSTDAGIHLINLPATGFNFVGTQPVGWVEAKLTKKGGEFTLHAIGGDRSADRQTQKLVWRA
jgi:Icc protein